MGSKAFAHKTRWESRNLFVPPAHKLLCPRTYCNCYKFLDKFALWQAPVSGTHPATSQPPRWSIIQAVSIFSTPPPSLVLWVLSSSLAALACLEFSPSVSSTFWAIFKSEIHFQLFGVPPQASWGFTYCSFQLRRREELQLGPSLIAAACWSVNIFTVGVNKIL